MKDLIIDRKYTDMYNEYISMGYVMHDKGVSKWMGEMLMNEQGEIPSDLISTLRSGTNKAIKNQYKVMLDRALSDEFGCGDIVYSQTWDYDDIYYDSRIKDMPNYIKCILVKRVCLDSGELMGGLTKIDKVVRFSDHIKIYPSQKSKYDDFDTKPILNRGSRILGYED